MKVRLTENKKKIKEDKEAAEGLDMIGAVAREVA
jgi:hypothetical protein